MTNRLRIKQTNETPPDKYRYVHPQDGHKTIAMGAEDWFSAILKHKKDNGYDVPSDWKEQAEDQLCRTLPPGWCFFNGGAPFTNPVDARFGLDDALRGTKVFVEFVRQGHPLVSPEEAERRGKICSSCYMPAMIPGCAPCVGFSNLVADVVGAKTTSADVMLEGKVCLVCKCSARAQLWIPVEVSKVGVDDAMMDQFPKEFCWKYKSLMELKTTQASAKD